MRYKKKQKSKGSDKSSRIHFGFNNRYKVVSNVSYVSVTKNLHVAWQNIKMPGINQYYASFM